MNILYSFKFRGKYENDEERNRKFKPQINLIDMKKYLR